MHPHSTKNVGRYQVNDGIKKNKIREENSALIASKADYNLNVNPLQYFLTASCYRNREKLQPHGPLSLYADLPWKSALHPFNITISLLGPLFWPGGNS